MLIFHDPIVEKIHKHLESVGLRTQILDSGLMDFEYDYPRIPLTGPSEGISDMGAMKVFDSSIDYLDIIKRKILEQSSFAPGGSSGLGVFEYTTWKMRFFLALPSSMTLGPLNLGTLTKILKQRFGSKVEDYIWSGFGKLTTLPPGTVYDDVTSILNSDKELKELMLRALLKEKVISVSVYSPKKKVEQSGGKESLAKVMITSEWKPQKDLFLDKHSLGSYERIAADLKGLITKLRYVLENY